MAPDPVVAPERPELRQRRRAPMRRGRFVVVRDAAEHDLWEKRRRARLGLPSPAAVTRDIALALLEVEAGCRSAVQLERIFSPELWEALDRRIGRRGGSLPPAGRSSRFTARRTGRGWPIPSPWCTGAIWSGRWRSGWTRGAVAGG